MSFVKEFYPAPIRKKKTEKEKKEAEDLRQKQRDEDSKMVTGVFENEEVSGGDVTFTYKAYKEDPHRQYHLEDGKTYTIPLGVAKHINNTTKHKKHEYLVGPDGKKHPAIGTPRRRFKFSSKEFM